MVGDCGCVSMMCYFGWFFVGFRIVDLFGLVRGCSVGMDISGGCALFDCCLV